MPASAVMTTVTDSGSNYGISLRVGSVSGVDTVTFNVTGNNAGLTPTAVTGAPTIGVWVTPIRPITTSATARPVTLRVDASVDLACQTPGCGTTSIPFSKISWTASANSNTASGDIQSGRFTGSANQQIANFNANATFCSALFVLCLIGVGWNYHSNAMDNTLLHFSYDNDVVYPAGTYRGAVRFTASME